MVSEMSCSEFRKYISAYIDHEISVDRALPLEEHLQACATCARRLQLEQWLAELVRYSYPRVPCPPALEDKIRKALMEQTTARPFLRALVAVAGSVAVVVLWIVVQMLRPAGTLPPRVALAAELYEELLRNELVLSVRSHDVATLDQWLSQRLPFYSRGALRSPEGLVPEGAGVVRLGSESLGAVTYRSPRGAALLLIGAAGQDPGGRHSVVLDGAKFHTFTVGRRKLVLWDHGELSYVLVSEGEHDGARACASCHTDVKSDRLVDFPVVTGEL